MKKTLFLALSLVSAVSYDTIASRSEEDTTLAVDRLATSTERSADTNVPQAVVIETTLPTTDEVSSASATPSTVTIDGTLNATSTQPSVVQTTETVNVEVPSVEETTVNETVLVPVEVTKTVLTPSTKTVAVDVAGEKLDYNNPDTSTTAVAVDTSTDQVVPASNQ